MTGVYLSRDLHRKLLKLWSPRVSSPGVPKFDWPQRLPLGLIFWPPAVKRESRRTICDVGVKILRKASAVTSVTESVAVRKYGLRLPDTPNQKGIMSSLHLNDTAKYKADLKHHDYGFVLALICMALALVVASAIFTPAPVGTGINDQISFVGP